jgi:hypothetical protein
MTLAMIPLLRVMRSRQAWAWLFATAALALGSAWVARSHHAPHGADDTLLNLYASVVVPILALAIATAGADGTGLARSAGTLYRLGAPARRVVAVTVGVTIGASALACAALGALVAAWAHGSADPPLVTDAFHTFAFGAVGGAAYAAYFGLGSAIGARGWGRLMLLIADWMLGGGVDVAASLTPRAHFRNLLGGEAPLDLAPSESLAVLAILTALCVVGATRITARRLRVAG